MWRPVEPRRETGCALHGVRGAPDVVGEERPRPLAAGLVPKAVKPELVAGGNDLPDEGGMPHDVLSGDEEDGVRARRGEGFEHRRGSRHVRPVVEGENHARAGSGANGNPEGPCRTGHDNACTREPVSAHQRGKSDAREYLAHGQSAGGGDGTDVTTPTELTRLDQERTSSCAAARPGRSSAVTIAPGATVFPRSEPRRAFD